MSKEKIVVYSAGNANCLLKCVLRCVKHNKNDITIFVGLDWTQGFIEKGSKIFKHAIFYEPITGYPGKRNDLSYVEYKEVLRNTFESAFKERGINIDDIDEFHIGSYWSDFSVFVNMIGKSNYLYEEAVGDIGLPPSSNERKFPALGQLEKELKMFTLDNPNIIKAYTTNGVDHVKNSIYNVVYELQSLNKKERKTLLKKYELLGLNLELDDKYDVLLTQWFYADNGLKKRHDNEIIIMYGYLIDFFLQPSDNILFKCHPADPKRREYAKYLEGILIPLVNFPSELFNIMAIKISSAITISSSSVHSFSGISEEQKMILNFDRFYKSIFKIHASVTYAKTNDMSLQYDISLDAIVKNLICDDSPKNNSYNSKYTKKCHIAENTLSIDQAVVDSIKNNDADYVIFGGLKFVNISPAALQPYFKIFEIVKKNKNHLFDSKPEYITLLSSNFGKMCYKKELKHTKIQFTVKEAEDVGNDALNYISKYENLPHNEDPISVSKKYKEGTKGIQNLGLSKYWIKKAVDQGVKRAENDLFDILWVIGTQESYSEMIQVATTFANAGDGGAMGRLGRAYRDGKGVEKDLNKAAEWMGKAVDKNVTWMRNELFDVLLKIDTPESRKEMISVISAHVESGDGGAMLRLGRAYRDGKGVEKDLNKAAEWMGKAVDKNVTCKDEL